MLIRKMGIALSLGLLVTCTLYAQGSGLAGAWDGESTHEGTTNSMQFTFVVNGNTFTGRIDYDTPCSGTWCEESAHKINDGRISGNRISFRTGPNNVVAVTGTLEGDKLNMTYNITDNGESLQVKATRKK